uniref:Caveolae associated protein 2b n=1 Tax=Amphiprion ocellaris TaxID=80972 RepID=A0AAQ6ADE3_AMPOC
MVTTETHESQDLLVPPKNQDQQDQDKDQQDQDQDQASSPLAGLELDKMNQGPVNAITVLTLLDKLVNMLDAVQENQHKMEEENEIPSTVFVKDPPPFPRDEILEEGEGTVEGNSSQEGGLQTIDLSSDEDVGLEAELEEEEVWPHDLENMEKSRAEKLKRSSLKKVDSLKKAFSRQNIEKKMTKIGTKIVSAEQREKIKQKTSSLKVSPLSFSIRKPRSSSDSQPPEGSTPTQEPLTTEADIQLSPLDSSGPDVPFTEVHAQLAPAEQQEEELREEEEVKEVEGKEEVEVEVKEEVEEVEEEVPVVLEADVSVVSEGVPEQYALSSTLPQEEKEDES